jgi:hypothetical protein
MADFTKRPLLEATIYREDIVGRKEEPTEDLTEHPDYESVVAWLERHSTASHNEETEYFLWIPPDGKWIDVNYKSCPDIVKQVLVQAVSLTQGQGDQGYLLLVIN